MHVARLVYEKLKEGDHVTAAELLDAHDHFKKVAELLHPLGPVFRLAAWEAEDTRQKMFHIMVSRGLATYTMVNKVRKEIEI